jgi:uncharacterized delta-60 repeat protein
MNEAFSFSKSIAALAVTGFAALIAPRTAAASPQFVVTSTTSAGLPDGNFAGGGQVKIDLDDLDGDANPSEGCGLVVVQDVAVRSDKIVVAGICGAYLDWQGGSFALRLTNKGARDNTFGDKGFARIRGITAHSVEIDSASRPVLGGEAGGHFAIARFTNAGLPDNSFGTAGVTKTNVAGMTGEQIAAIAIQSNNRIVVAGDGLSSSTGVGVVLAVGRYTDGGVLDNSFAGNGLTATNFSSSSEEIARSIAVAVDGKIVVGGRCRPDNTAIYQFAAARYSETGVLDPSFDGDGKVMLVIPGVVSAYGYAMGVDLSRRVVLAGFANFSGRPEFLIARTKENGALDTSYGTGGSTHTNFGSSTSEAIYDLKVLTNDKVLVTGVAAVNGHDQIAGARYLSTGLEDLAFQTDGKILINVSGYDEEGTAIAYDTASQKTIIVGGIN